MIPLPGIYCVVVLTYIYYHLLRFCLFFVHSRNIPLPPKENTSLAEKGRFDSPAT